MPASGGSNPPAPANHYLSISNTYRFLFPELLIQRLLHFAATESMFEVGFVGSIQNVLRRGGIFYFRRAVPVELRHRLRKRELTRSLATSRLSSPSIPPSETASSSFSYTKSTSPVRKSKLSVLHHFVVVVEVTGERQHE